MKSAQRLLSVLTLISFSTMLPLSANASPQLVTHRAKCIASESDIVTIDDRSLRDFGLKRSKFIRARVAGGSQNNAGLRAKVLGLGKPSPTGIRFKTLLVVANLDPNRVDPANCFIVLDFDMPGTEPDQRRIVSFKDARLHSSLSLGFKTYAVDNNRHVKDVSNGALKAVAVLLQGGSSGQQEITIGDVTAAHSGASNSDVELWLTGEQDSCNLLDNPDAV